MTTHASHKHIIPVQILKADRASEHVVLVLLGAARGALSRALSKHAWPVKLWGCPWVADIEHLRDTCTTIKMCYAAVACRMLCRRESSVRTSYRNVQYACVYASNSVGELKLGIVTAKGTGATAPLHQP